VVYGVENQVGLTLAATVVGSGGPVNPSFRESLMFFCSSCVQMSALGLEWDRAFGDLEDGINEKE